jgi:hypothetical protein
MKLEMDDQTMWVLIVLAVCTAIAVVAIFAPGFFGGR